MFASLLLINIDDTDIDCLTIWAFTAKNIIKTDTKWSSILSIYLGTNWSTRVSSPSNWRSSKFSHKPLLRFELVDVSTTEPWSGICADMLVRRLTDVACARKLDTMTNPGLPCPMRAIARTDESKLRTTVAPLRIEVCWKRSFANCWKSCKQSCTNEIFFCVILLFMLPELSDR